MEGEVSNTKAEKLRSGDVTHRVVAHALQGASLGERNQLHTCAIDKPRDGIVLVIAADRGEGFLCRGPGEEPRAHPVTPDHVFHQVVHRPVIARRPTIEFLGIYLAQS